MMQNFTSRGALAARANDAARIFSGRMIRSCLSALAALGLFAVIGLAPVRAAENFVIGTALVLSGANARAGQEQLHGLQCWVEQVNARGGLLGHPVVLVSYDDGGEAEASARVVERLIAEDKASVVIGPYSSDTGLAAAAVAEQHAVPMLLPAAVTKRVWERGYTHVFGLAT